MITPVRHIAGVPEILESTGQVTYMDDPTLLEVIAIIGEYDAIYTNPNKSKVFIGKSKIAKNDTLFLEVQRTSTNALTLISSAAISLNGARCLVTKVA